MKPRTHLRHSATGRLSPIGNYLGALKNFVELRILAGMSAIFLLLITCTY